MLNFQRLFFVFVFVVSAFSQQGAPKNSGILRGVVSDESGAVIPGSVVTAVGPDKAAKRAVADNSGNFTISGLTPGMYAVTATADGMAPIRLAAVNVQAGVPQVIALAMKVATEKQEVTVQESTTGLMVSTDPSSNAGALVLRQEDLAALPDDPDDLAADLQALAGPSAGPNGGQIFIDGFSGGQLPPKESIREIRINSNPFSAEYDRVGFGRIEILTKPGSDHFRGQIFFSSSDQIFNAKNPFAGPNKPDYLSRQYGGNFSGPLGKRASFFFDFDRREIEDVAVINAVTLGDNFVPNTIFASFPTPQERMSIGPRIDYQINASNTLTARYRYTRNNQDGQGIGGFVLASNGSNLEFTDHTVQLTETAVLNAHTINETRFEFTRERSNNNYLNPGTTINVLDSFTGGGASSTSSYNLTNNFELQNFTSWTFGAHNVKAGFRLRTSSLDNLSPNNFLGSFTFSGAQGVPVLDANNQPTGALTDITSIESYRRTLLFQQLGYSPTQIRALGGLPSQFQINAGTPFQSLNQLDLGLYVQDDWRIRPNLTFSYGLRYEYQTNISDWRDFAPRFGLAWAPGGGKSRQPKTVVRAGSGIFYDRFNDTNVLQAERFNGVNQVRYIVRNPAFFSTIPATSQLPQAVSTISSIDKSLRAPYLIQSAIGVERQIKFGTIAVNYTNSRGVHELLTRNINAPLPGTNVIPYPGSGPLYQYESNGILNQNQIFVNLNLRIGRKVTLFTGYINNHAKSNTDGVNTFPSNQYNLAGDYGRSSLDIRHRLFLGGSITAKWNVRLSPFIIARSALPYNITIGQDLLGTTLFNQRPSFATSGTPGAIDTQFGDFNPTPPPGSPTVERNFFDGPSQFSANLRVSRTWGFGPSRNQRAGPPPSSDGGGGPGGGGAHGGRGGGGMGGGRGGMGGGFGDVVTEHRYNMTLSVQARNLFNHENFSNYTSSLQSPIFGEPNSLANNGNQAAGAASNRRIELQVRFSF